MITLYKRFFGGKLKTEEMKKEEYGIIILSIMLITVIVIGINQAEDNINLRKDLIECQRSK